MSSNSESNLVAPSAVDEASESTTKRSLTRREQHRLRRLAVFQAWDKGGTFADVGREFGLTGVRTRQIVLKAVMSDNCRSERARAWMAQLDTDGYWLARYDRGFQRGLRRGSKTSR